MRVRRRAEGLCRGAELSSTEGGFGKAELEMGHIVVRRQEPFKAVTLSSVGLCQNDGGSPLSAEALEVLGALFDVNPDGNKVRGDELADLLLRVDLGIQPSTSPSHRRGAEIEQRHLMRRLGLLESLVRIAYPLNCGHRVLLCKRPQAARDASAKDNAFIRRILAGYVL